MTLKQWIAVEQAKQTENEKHLRGRGYVARPCPRWWVVDVNPRAQEINLIAPSDLDTDHPIFEEFVTIGDVEVDAAAGRTYLTQINRDGDKVRVEIVDEDDRFDGKWTPEVPFRNYEVVL